MRRKDEAPTAEEVADAAGGDIESARLALKAIRVRDRTDDTDE